MDNPENHTFTAPGTDAVVDLSNAYVVPAIFHAILQSPAARVASATNRDIIVELMIYVRDNHPGIWQSIDSKPK